MKPSVKVLVVLSALALSVLGACAEQAATPTPTTVAKATPTAAVGAPTPTVATVVATPTPTTVAVATATVAKAQPQGTINLAVNSLGTETYILRISTGEAPMRYIGEPLLWWDFTTDSPKVGAILSSWDMKVNPDKTMDWVFHIRPGVQFQKGWGEVTAEDVKFTFTEFLKPGSVNAFTVWDTLFFGSDPDNLKVVDKYTLNIHTPTIRNPVETLRAMSVGDARSIRPFSKAYFQKVGEEAFGNSPVMAGTYEFVSAHRGYDVLIKAVDNHYRVTPGFAQIHYYVVTETSTRNAMLKTGQVDIGNVNGQQVKDMAAAGLKILQIPRQGEAWMNFGGLFPTRATYDPTVPWATTDPMSVNAIKVRKALTLAIDGQAIIDRLLYGYGDLMPVTFSYFGPGYPWWDDAWKPYPYDLKQAKQLLAEAGYPNCFAFKMWIVPGHDVFQDMGDVIASIWTQDLGCKIERVVGEYRPGLRGMLTNRTSAWYIYPFGCCAGGADLRSFARPANYACTHGGPTWQAVVHTEMPMYSKYCTLIETATDPAQEVLWERQMGDEAYKAFATASILATTGLGAVGPKIGHLEVSAAGGAMNFLEYATPK